MSLSGFNSDRKIGFLPAGGNLKLFGLVTLHWLIVFANLVSFIILPFLTPWYIACPLMTWIGLLSCSRVLDCPLTRYENKIRRELGKPEIKGFIRHYVLVPYVRNRRKK